MPAVRPPVSTRVVTRLKTLTGVKHDDIRQLHDLLVNLLSKWLRLAKIPHMDGVGGFKRTCRGLFTEFANQLPKLDPNNPAHAAALRYRQNIIPDLIFDLALIDLPENIAQPLGGRTLADMKTLAPGAAHSESTSAAFSHSAEKRPKCACGALVGRLR